MQENAGTPNPTFTILLPIHRGPHLLPYAVESVLRQCETSFELFIVCDGAPEATADYARACAARDPRIHAFVCPKGERFGEAHRHAALRQARGRFVAQIADDDLWFDNHLLELATLLRTVDFGHLIQVSVETDESIFGSFVDLADSQTRTELKLHATPGLGGPTVVGYRLEAYRRLPQGWSPAPIDVPTDVYMWRKFLALPDMRFGTRVAITALHLGTPFRRDWSAAERERETARWAARLKDPGECDRIRQQALLVMCRQARAFHMLGPMKLRRFIQGLMADPRVLTTDSLWLWSALRSRFQRP